MALEPVQFLFSESTITYLQGLGNHFFDFLFLAISFFLSEPGFMSLATIIFWCYDKKIGIRLMYVTLFSAFAAIFAKSFFALPRPPEYLHKTNAEGFGFPSGHALVSSSFCAYLGGEIKKLKVIVLGAIAILAVSLSRIYLGVHYAGDVLGGVFFGLLIAFVSLKTEPSIVIKLQKYPKTKYFTLIFLPFVVVAAAIMQRSSFREYAEIGIVMAGIGAGYLLEENYIKLEDAKNNTQRIKRTIAGILTTIMVYLFSSMLLSMHPDFIFFKYASLGLTSTFIAPWIVTRLEEL